VSIEFGGIEVADADPHDPLHEPLNEVVVRLNTAQGRYFIKIRGKHAVPMQRRLEDDLILTAYHEAGHALVDKVFFADYREPKYIKVLPGIANIADEFIYYAGIAGAKNRVQVTQSLEFVLREIAVLMGGAVAEELVTQSGISTTGKYNDIERATLLAEKAVQEFGLVKEWGYRASRNGADSEGERELLAKLVKKLLDDGTTLAKWAIMANPEVFTELGNDLARKGVVNEEGLKNIFSSPKLFLESHGDLEEAAKKHESLFQVVETNPMKRGLSTKFNPALNILPFNQVIKLEEKLEKQRSEEIAKLKISGDIPIGKLAPLHVQPKNACEIKLTKKEAVTKNRDTQR
jgi:hypothetical protein